MAGKVKESSRLEEIVENIKDLAGKKVVGDVFTMLYSGKPEEEMEAAYRRWLQDISDGRFGPIHSRKPWEGGLDGKIKGGEVN